MAWPVTTISERELRLREGISTGLKLPAVPGRASNIGVISAEVSGEIDDIHQHIRYQAKQRFTKTADLDGLKTIAAEYGMAQKAETASVGAITFAGADGVTLEAGERWKHANGQFYVTSETVTIAGGTATVSAQAEATGPAGNLAAGQSLSLVSPVSGVASNATVSTAFADGRAIEAVEAFRARILYRQAKPPMGGSDADYVVWATEINGVDGVWVSPQAMGLNTVTVRIASYDQNGWPVPTENIRQGVATHIDGHINEITGQWEGRPSGAQVFVVVIDDKLVDLDFSTLIPSDAKTLNAIASNVQSLFRRSGEPNQQIRESWLRAAISAAVGEDYHTLASPIEGISLGVNELPVLNTIKLNGTLLWERPL
jgi:uncharacterized phage protein gp47/JayE